MGGWFRTFTHDFNGTPNQGNYNQFASEAVGPARTMKGIVFDRGRDDKELNEWDGQPGLRPSKPRALRSPTRRLFSRRETARPSGRPLPKTAGSPTAILPGSATAKNWPAPLRCALPCNRERKRSSPWSSRGTSPWCNLARDANGTGATRIFTAQRAPMHGRLRATGCLMPPNGAMPSTPGKRPM